jgi:hypothetical protein
MKTYNTKTIKVQLFQIQPRESLLATPSPSVKRYLTESKVLEDTSDAYSLVSTSETIGEIIAGLQKIEDRNDRARRITGAFNKFLSESEIGERMGYDPELSGVRVSDVEPIKEGVHRKLMSAMVAQLRFDRFTKDGNPVFTVVVKNALFFDKNLEVLKHAQFLNDRRSFRLPAYDRANQFNNILRSVQFVPVFHFEKSDRRSKESAKRIGERFMDSGRMAEDEYASLVKAQTKFPVGFATSYSNYKKQYCYPARDLEIIASDALVGFGNTYSQIEFPEDFSEAIALYKHGKSQIREMMDDKAELMGNLQATLRDYFLFEDPVEAECNSIVTPRFRVKRAKDKKAVEEGTAYYTDGVAGFGRNVLCYPTDSFEDKKEKFLSLFSKASKVTKLGIQFEHVDYSASMAVKEPIRVAERIIESAGECCAALVVWPNWPNLPNNKLLEFELMRRGVAVQNVVNENRHKDALKMSALMKGMAEKFPLDENVKIDEGGTIAPFDYALGLDVSRHGKKDVASFPVVVDRFGKASCTLGETLYTKDKEKRSNEEIIRVIKTVLDSNEEDGTRPVNILFLRDGVAFEDYESIASSLPEHVTLTVVSVRKNLMTACSDDMPEGEFHSVYANHDEHRFVFGVNARQGDKAKVTRLHMAQVMMNPLSLSNKVIGDILITLSCQNKTTEMEMGSLPFPIAYADRTAGDIRDIVEDSALCWHVRTNYPEEVDAAGGASNYIYQELKRFVETRPNGYSFAV